MTGAFTLRQTTGLLFILAAVAFGIAATVLSMSFEWPDILREEPAYVLTKYRDGGDSLTFIWLAVAWTYFLLIFPVVMLGKVLDEDGKSTLATLATTIGVLAVIASVVGFLRWVLSCPTWSIFTLRRMRPKLLVLEWSLHTRRSISLAVRCSASMWGRFCP